MSYNISGFGLQVLVQASNTLPVPYPISAFADDADPIDCPSVQIADKAMGMNGDMVHWSKANPCLLTLNVIPSSLDDTILNSIMQANRPGKNKIPANDSITITKMWPNGAIETWSGGTMTDGLPGLSAASAGRMKTKAYQFAFEDYSYQPGAIVP